MRPFTFTDGFSVSRIGLGTMRLTGQPGNYGPFQDWEGGVALLRAAYDAGVRHFDTARAYGPHFSERLIADALSPYADDVLIATKGGINKDGSTMAHITVDGRPEALTEHIDQSLADLKTDRIGLYYLHRPDPEVPLADSIGAIETARQAGKIARIGVSNVTEPQLREAMAIAHISAVQNRYDPLNGGDDAVLSLTTESGIAFVPWGPLAAKPLEYGTPLAASPDGVKEALLNLLSLASNVLPIPGTTSVQNMLANSAVQLEGHLV